MRRLSKLNSGVLDITVRLLEPLSHIGESHGTDSYLDTQTIIGPEGRPVEVFSYHGNAVRGMLRDHGAKYLLDHLASGDATVQVPLDVFYLLFSGGSLGGEQSADIDQARRIRNAVPLLSVFGGGVGNQILPGKIRCNDLWPVCKETRHLIPERLREAPGVDLSWRVLTVERSFTRRDDGKDDNLRPYLAQNVQSALPQAPAQGALLEDNSEGTASEKKGREKKDAPQQMRYTIECLAAGATLWGEIYVLDVTDVEMGALTSAIAEWSKVPFIGGQNRIGLGRVDAEIVWRPAGGTEQPFATIRGGAPLALGLVAAAAKQAYDEFLRAYARHLEENKSSITRALMG